MSMTGILDENDLDSRDDGMDVTEEGMIEHNKVAEGPYQPDGDDDTEDESGYSWDAENIVMPSCITMAEEGVDYYFDLEGVEQDTWEDDKPDIRILDDIPGSIWKLDDIRV